MHYGKSLKFPTLTDEVVMLVLTRKAGEEIVIGGNIRLTVTQIGEGRVKIGIEAPRHVRVDRAEIAEKLMAFAGAEFEAELVGAN